MFVTQSSEPRSNTPQRDGVAWMMVCQRRHTSIKVRIAVAEMKLIPLFVADKWKTSSNKVNESLTTITRSYVNVFTWLGFRLIGLENVMSEYLDQELDWKGRDKCHCIELPFERTPFDREQRYLFFQAWAVTAKDETRWSIMGKWRFRHNSRDTES